jgi:hypothetical protein
LRPKQPKYQRIGCLANSPDGCGSSLSFETTQASTINKRFWVFAERSTNKFSNSVADLDFDCRGSFEPDLFAWLGLDGEGSCSFGGECRMSRFA